MSRKGFTLIELLVVISIIAVLAAMLFPVFTIAKENGIKTVCMTHGKQLAAALLQYMSNWNDRFPRQNYVDNYYGPGPVGGVNPEDLLPIDLRVLLNPYCKSKAIWNCRVYYAQFGKRYSWDWSTGKGLPSWQYLATDNYWAWDRMGLEAKPLSAVTAPSRKCALFDCFVRIGGPANPQDYVPHLGGTILAYVDGHVRWHRVLPRQTYLAVDGYQYPPYAASPTHGTGD